MRKDGAAGHCENRSATYACDDSQRRTWRGLAGGSMNESRILVVGATGQLGGVITQKLIPSGVRGRALARNPQALAPLGPAAGIAPVDLPDVANITEAR